MIAARPKRRKTKFGLNEHIAAGRQMQGAYLRVLHLETVFTNTYGRRSEISKQLKKVSKELFAAKDKADDIFFAENINVQHSPYFGEYYSKVK
jgi:hypothetical protein